MVPKVLEDVCQSVPGVFGTYAQTLNPKALGVDFPIASSHKVEAKPIHQEFHSSLRIMECTLKSMYCELNLNLEGVEVPY